MEKMVKRQFWTEPEITQLLIILEEINIVKLFNNKKYRDAEIFTMVETKLKEKGIMKNSNQIKIKWKALKSKYYETRAALNVSGAGTDAMLDCPFYDELHSLFKSTPRASFSPVDSILIGDEGKGKQSLSQHDDVYQTITEDDISDQQSNEKFTEEKEENKSKDESTQREKPEQDTDKKPKISSRARVNNKKKLLEDLTQEMKKEQESIIAKLHEEQRESEKNMFLNMEKIFSNSTSVLLNGLKSIYSPATSNFSQPYYHPMVSMYPPFHSQQNFPVTMPAQNVLNINEEISAIRNNMYGTHSVTSVPPDTINSIQVPSHIQSRMMSTEPVTKLPVSTDYLPPDNAPLNKDKNEQDDEFVPFIVVEPEKNDLNELNEWLIFEPKD